MAEARPCPTFLFTYRPALVSAHTQRSVWATYLVSDLRDLLGDGLRRWRRMELTSAAGDGRASSGGKRSAEHGHREVRYSSRDDIYQTGRRRPSR